jgi:hypothetical protein
MASITAIIAARKAGIEPSIKTTATPPAPTAERLICESRARSEIGYAVTNRLKPTSFEDGSNVFFRAGDINRIVEKVIAALS